jgi:hypothetical protein
MGIVAPSAHHSGKNKSAVMPSTVKVAQKIFFSIDSSYRFAPRLPRAVEGVA